MEEQNLPQLVETDRPLVITGGNKKVKGRLKELSLRTARAESPVPAKPGTRLMLEFEIPAKNRFAKIKAGGTVKHLAIRNDFFDLIIEFTDLSEAQKEAIQEYIDYKNRLKKVGMRRNNPY